MAYVVVLELDDGSVDYKVSSRARMPSLGTKLTCCWIFVPSIS